MIDFHLRLPRYMHQHIKRNGNASHYLTKLIEDDIIESREFWKEFNCIATGKDFKTTKENTACVKCGAESWVHCPLIKKPICIRCCSHCDFENNKES
jgi:hypothetical protein